MNILEIIIIAIGLSMDAFAVSVSGGMTLKKVEFKNALKVGLCFGFFQGFMPAIGWLSACKFCKYIEMFDNWIALILLSIIGCKMIYEGVFKNDDDNANDITNLKTLLILGIATSIDALMVGVTFVTTYTGLQILLPVAIIGITTLLTSTVGVYIGKKSGDILGNKAEIIGGIILVLIGLKIFFF